jgi:hypothetical protein
MPSCPLDIIGNKLLDTQIDNKAIRFFEFSLRIDFFSYFRLSLLCTSCKTVKNGRIHNGKQRFKCQVCRRQFVEQPTKKVIDSATCELIDRLLLERISLAGIARVTQVSAQWLQTYVNEKYAQVPRSVQVTPKKRALNDSVR